MKKEKSKQTVVVVTTNPTTKTQSYLKASELVINEDGLTVEQLINNYKNLKEELANMKQLFKDFAKDVKKHHGALLKAFKKQMIATNVRIKNLEKTIIELGGTL